MYLSRLLIPVVLLLNACALEAPRYSDVVTVRAGSEVGAAQLPGPGTVWRLEETELRALSPAPYVEPPPPPKLAPPPRPNDPPPAYHAPYYGSPYPYWSGPGFYYWRSR